MAGSNNHATRYRIKDVFQHPPNGGWQYIQPESGTHIKAMSLEELVSKVKAHREANNYPRPTRFEVAEDVQAWICAQLPPDARAMTCLMEGESGFTEYPSISVDHVKRFLRVTKELLASARGARFVGEKEALRRASICAQCPYNIKVPGCTGCQGIANAVFEVIGKRQTPLDSMLRQCGVCGCSNTAQVWVPMRILAKTITPEMEFPEWCWKRDGQTPKADAS